MISDAVIGFGNDVKGIDTIRDGAELCRREKNEERRKRYVMLRTGNEKRSSAMSRIGLESSG